MSTEVEPGTRPVLMGAGPAEFIRQRSAMRTARNPLDRATVVSIFPRDVIEEKITMQPSKYIIPAGSILKPSVTVIEPASWWKDVDYDQPLIEIPVSATVVAESVIVDYCRGLLGCNMADEMPGMFFVPGAFTPMEISVKYSDAIRNAEENQKRWYLRLVNIADSLWSKAQNPLIIWDLMRVAAEYLKLDKPWTKNFQSIEMIRCFACGSMKDPGYPVCMVCKTIDKTHPLAKEVQFAS